MLDIVFSDSALGSLKLAQSWGKGESSDGPIGVIVHHEDGTPATPEEIEQARKKAEERYRRAWETAVPLGGSPNDCFGFSLAFSEGAVSEGEDFWANRQRVLERHFSLYPDDWQVAGELWSQGEAAVDTLFRRAGEGEPLRVWYSHCPEEYSGLCWLMDQLAQRPHGDIFLIRQPSWEPGEDAADAVVRRDGWGEVEPGRWGRYLPLAEKAPDLLPAALGREWRESMGYPLRAVISGRLCGVEEDFYDWLILRELAAAPEEFQEARLIGTVLGRYRLGLSDSWLALRIEALIARGLLEPLTPPPADAPAYHRLLRKVPGGL